jgi:hypothetical protein
VINHIRLGRSKGEMNITMGKKQKLIKRRKRGTSPRPTTLDD